jgi:predicted RNA-binding Zn ribbon-like protein
VHEIEFPLLGEPLPVDFANTLHFERDEPTDDLATTALIRGWFAATGRRSGLECPHRLSSKDSQRIRECRDAVAKICRACATHRVFPRGPVSALNSFTAAAPAAPFVTIGADDEIRISQVHVGGPVDVMLGRIAFATIDLISGPRGDLLRVCEGDDCSMLFVKNHSRRRWCTDGCGHRDRQARYYQRTTNP